MLKLNRFSFLILLSLMTSIVIIVGGCKRATTPGETGTASGMTATSSVVEPTEAVTPQPIGTSGVLPYPLSTSTSTALPYPLPTEVNPSASISPYPGPRSTQTESVTLVPQVSLTPTEVIPSLPAYPAPSSPTPRPGYPGPQSTPTHSSYPGPLSTPTKPPYPGPSTPTPRPTRTAIGVGTPSSTVLVTQVSPTSTAPIFGTPTTGTPGSIPTERPPGPSIIPPPPGSSVVIWHAWSIAETEVLESIIDSFTRLYPDVDFQIQYIPQDELFQRYHDAAYLDGGPSILIGPADWGDELARDDLVVDLSEYTSPEFLATFNPPALASGFYGDRLVSLPLSQSGLVMFRNQLLIPDPPSTFEELSQASRMATKAGNVGSYLELGAYFSTPSILGLGGQLFDDNGFPAFDSISGVEWLELLQAFDNAGAVTFNTNRDLEMFKRGRVGIIIDGTWNISRLAEAIGVENLAIDPWPEYGTGNLSGWVYVDSIYINSNLSGNDLTAALSFAGYLSDPNVQTRLAEVGHIPSVMRASPRDRLLHQAMVAFSNGVPFPGEVDERIISAYWIELNKAISDVFVQGKDPEIALQEARDRIIQTIRELTSTP